MSDAPVAAIPPVQADLTQGEGDATRINKQWYYYWRNLGQKIDTLGLAIQYGTHDTRPNPDEVPPGSLFSEGSVLYQNQTDGWHYLAGTQWGTLSPDQRPTWLGPKDAGYDFRTTDTNDIYAPREFIWSGSAWVEATFQLYGTHASRPAADSLTPPRTFYTETDRGNVLYQQQANAWHFVSGAMSGTLSPDQRPTDLGANDTGFEFRGTDQQKQYVWSGSAWIDITGAAANQALIAYSSADLTITGASQDLPGSSITLPTAGKWLITGCFTVTVATGDFGFTIGCHWNANGSGTGPTAFLQASTATTTSISRQWMFTAAAGNFVRLMAFKTGGSGASVAAANSSISALWVSP